MKQKQMEAHLEKTLHENNVVQRDTLNGMMKCSGGSCSFADRTLTMEFPVDRWQTNRVGQIHGGMICTAFDVTLAALARFFAGENYAPTVSLDVKYIRPVEAGDTLIVTAKAAQTGLRITQLTGEAVRKSDGKLAATAASIFMNIDTMKERLGGR